MLTMHCAPLVNNLILPPGETAKVVELNLPITPEENASLATSQGFFYSGSGYMLEQGTKPATISIALMSSPIALLSW